MTASSTVSALPSALTRNDHASRTQRALLEAQRMSEAIRELARTARDGGPSTMDLFPLMEAIRACTVTLDAAVDPLVEEAQAA
jgi:hypothetical protein